MKAIFLRALEETDDKSRVILEAITSPGRALGQTRFEIESEAFQNVPRSPFAYWVSDRVRGLFSELSPFESGGRVAKQGLATADDFRFVRAWTEIGAASINQHWFPFAKGGKFSPFYADIFPVVKWKDDGKEIRNFVDPQSRRQLSRPQNTDYFFRPGLTWPLRGIRYSAQAVPAGCVFSIAGKMAFGDANDLPWLHGLFNSRPFDTLISFFAGKIGGVQYEVGLLQNIPIPELTTVEGNALMSTARASWSKRRSLDSRVEISHAFYLPALLQIDGNCLADRGGNWFKRVTLLEEELVSLQAKLDDLCFEIYGIECMDRDQIEKGLGSGLDDTNGEESVEAEEEEFAELDIAPLVASLLSWCVGVAFGRFDLRLATAERSEPNEPDPFDSLPICSPGMLTSDDGFLVDVPPDGYPIDFPSDGVLVDDPGAPRDLIAACRQVFGPIFDDPTACWEEAAEILDDRATGLRTWFAKQFFGQHIKRYSKSRRKAPIYWQLATPSASYSAWLYYHQFTRDTLFRVLNDHVAPKLQHEERRLTNLIQGAGPDPSSMQRKEIANQDFFVGELRVFRDEVARVAPLWNPNLNDGVILNFAPLWRLMPQHKAWQKECKKAWDKLCKGDYDWAHIAMHLWPERVVPKCAKDRSLAIAHGLEDVFWQEDGDGKWHRRKADSETVEQLIAERTVPAVESALDDLISAPAPTGGRRRRTRS
jgi:hypothetical protein